MADGHGERSDGVLAALRTQLQALEARVRAIEEGPGLEGLRTRRVTVVDEAGVARVVLSAQHQVGSVLVRVDSPSGFTTGAEMYAWEDPDGGESGVGLCVYREGDVVGWWPE